MKTLIRSLLGAFALCLVASHANAAATYLSKTPYGGGGISGWEITLPASFAAGDTAIAILPTASVWGVNPNGNFDGTTTTSIMLGGNISGAGDSVNTRIDFGWTASGPWQTAYTMANTATNFFGVNTNYKILSDVATTTLPPSPFVRVWFLNKGATLTSKKAFFQFLRIGDKK